MGSRSQTSPTFPSSSVSSSRPWSADSLAGNLLAGEKKEVGGMGHGQPSFPLTPCRFSL